MQYTRFKAEESGSFQPGAEVPSRRLEMWLEGRLYTSMKALKLNSRARKSSICYL